MSAPGGATYPPFQSRGTQQPRVSVRVDQELEAGGRLLYEAGFNRASGLTHSTVGPFLLDDSDLGFVQARYEAARPTLPRLRQLREQRGRPEPARRRRPGTTRAPRLQDPDLRSGRRQDLDRGQPPPRFHRRRLSPLRIRFRLVGAQRRGSQRGGRLCARRTSCRTVPGRHRPPPRQVQLGCGDHLLPSPRPALQAHGLAIGACFFRPLLPGAHCHQQFLRSRASSDSPSPSASSIRHWATSPSRSWSEYTANPT